MEDGGEYRRIVRQRTRVGSRHNIRTIARGIAQIDKACTEAGPGVERHRGAESDPIECDRRTGAAIDARHIGKRVRQRSDAAGQVVKQTVQVLQAAVERHDVLQSRSGRGKVVIGAEGVLRAGRNAHVEQPGLVGCIGLHAAVRAAAAAAASLVAAIVSLLGIRLTSS